MLKRNNRWNTNACGYVDGHLERIHKNKKYAIPPTLSSETMKLSCAIDAKKIDMW